MPLLNEPLKGFENLFPLSRLEDIPLDFSLQNGLFLFAQGVLFPQAEVAAH